jgi:hypothetical protein
MDLHSGPIFVVGCGHSGTSITARLIGAHPNIFPVPGETKIAVGRCAARFVDGLAKFTRQAEENSRARWLEKTPQPILEISFILELAAEAFVVAIVRDPRDVCFSFQKRYGDLQIGIDKYIAAHSALLPLLDHPRIRVFRYEDLVHDPKRVLQSTMAFLGEIFLESQLLYYQQKVLWYAESYHKPASDLGVSHHNQLRNWQINQPFFDGRGKWCGKLKPDELHLIKDRLGVLSGSFGYRFD